MGSAVGPSVADGTLAVGSGDWDSGGSSLGSVLDGAEDEL